MEGEVISELIALCDGSVDADASIVNEPAHGYTGSEHYRKNVIVQQTFEFAVAILKYSDRLKNERRWLLNQIQRSGCSIGAKVKEAQNAESLKDFIHKMKIALKEADETEYWYHLLAATNEHGVDRDIHERLQIILRILNKMISTAKTRTTKPIR